jgi:lysophospholipase L1-like esterase
VLQTLLGSGWDVNNYGLTGRTMLKQGTVSYWYENQYTQAKDFNPNVVIIKLGTNDANAPINWNPYQAYFISDYKDMIHEFEALAAKPKIYVCQVIKMFSKTIDVKDTTIVNQINPKVLSVALDEGVNLIDLYTPLNNISYFQSDSIHPNETGAARIAFIVDSIFDLATPQISKNSSNVLSTQGASGYQWYKNSIKITGATNSTYQVTEDGYYKVSLKLSSTSQTRLVSDSLLVSLSDPPPDSSDTVSVAFYPNLSDKSVKIIATRAIQSIHLESTAAHLNKTATVNNDTVIFRVKYSINTGFTLETE